MEMFQGQESMYHLVLLHAIGMGCSVGRNLLIINFSLGNLKRLTFNVFTNSIALFCRLFISTNFRLFSKQCLPFMHYLL